MKTIHEIRHENFMKLVSQFGKSELADLLGHSSQSTISQLINKSPDSKTGKPKNIGDVIARKIEKATGKTEGWLDQNQNEKATSHTQGGNGFDDAPPLRTLRDVPVVGTVQAGDLGLFEELEYPVGHGDGYIRYPLKDPSTYALRVRGDSMRPRIKSGEFIVVEPSTEPSSGDDVAVVTKDGRKMVKELLYIRDGEVCLGSINQDHPNITIAIENIEKIHYVAGIIPRGAFYKQV